MKGDGPISALDAFVQVFGEEFGTAQVLAAPTDSDRKTAKALLKTVPQGPIVRDLAIVCAREVANVFEQHGMRPADFADMSDLSTKVQLLLKEALASDEGQALFEAKLREYVRLRG